MIFRIDREKRKRFKNQPSLNYAKIPCQASTTHELFLLPI